MPFAAARVQEDEDRSLARLAGGRTKMPAERELRGKGSLALSPGEPLGNRRCQVGGERFGRERKWSWGHIVYCPRIGGTW